MLHTACPSRHTDGLMSDCDGGCSFPFVWPAPRLSTGKAALFQCTETLELKLIHNEHLLFPNFAVRSSWMAIMGLQGQLRYYSECTKSENFGSIWTCFGLSRVWRPPPPDTPDVLLRVPYSAFIRSLNESATKRATWRTHRESRRKGPMPPDN